VADDCVLVVSANPTATAAELLATWIRRLEGQARLAIPGGSAATVIAPLRRRLGEYWRKVCLTWVDERCVPFEHHDSNRGSAIRAGWLDAGDPPALELALYENDETPAAAVARVAHRLTSDFRDGLDFTLMGMGEDGHIASIFPGWRAPDALVAYVEDSPKPPPKRITLTPAILRTARRHLLFATGSSKRAALVRLLDGDPTVPGTQLSALTIVTDQRIGQ
jgi:6-phosphogluconolactonase